MLIRQMCEYISLFLIKFLEKKRNFIKMLSRDMLSVQTVSRQNVTEHQNIDWLLFALGVRLKNIFIFILKSDYEINKFFSETLHERLPSTTIKINRSRQRF